MTLIQYIITFVIVILFLVGAALLSLRLRTRDERDQQLEEEVQLEVLDDQPKRSLFRALRGERTRVF